MSDRAPVGSFLYATSGIGLNFGCFTSLLTRCTWSIFSLPCLHVCLDVFNINLFFTLICLSLGCLGLCWTIFADMSNLQATETSGLVQPSAVVSLEMCSDTVLRYMSILLTIMKTFPCVVVPIVMVCIVVSFCMLIWCPHRL